MDDYDSVLWHLIAGTRGGPTRLQILLELYRRPYNTNQIAELLALDYKTVTRHLEILVENGLITTSKEVKQKRYGELYHLTDFARSKVQIFAKILERVKKEDLG
ncbi:winged helix-turn-helix transcriptional regulator [Candidatus Micrarchaeota archaeon]|nr:winged helix-turn-helix transcriptional regulator [Candidatus Micrarchaeota archaeon]